MSLKSNIEDIRILEMENEVNLVELIAKTFTTEDNQLRGGFEAELTTHALQSPNQLLFQCCNNMCILLAFQE